MEARHTRNVLLVAALVALTITACGAIAPVAGYKAESSAGVTATSPPSTTVPDRQGPELPDDVIGWECEVPDDCEVLLIDPATGPFLERGPLRPPTLHHFRAPAAPSPEDPLPASSD
jgi:hypothetical protein